MARPVRIENEEALCITSWSVQNTCFARNRRVYEISNSPGIRVSQIERHTANIDHGEVPGEVLCPD